MKNYAILLVAGLVSLGISACSTSFEASDEVEGSASVTALEAASSSVQIRLESDKAGTAVYVDGVSSLAGVEFGLNHRLDRDVAFKVADPGSAAMVFHDQNGASTSIAVAWSAPQESDGSILLGWLDVSEEDAKSLKLVGLDSHGGKNALMTAAKAELETF